MNSEGDQSKLLNCLGCLCHAADRAKLEGGHRRSAGQQLWSSRVELQIETRTWPGCKFYRATNARVKT